MKLRAAVALVGGEGAIDALCAPPALASPLPVTALARSLQQIRAEQPRLVVRLMDSPLSPSLETTTTGDPLSQLILRDPGQVARRFIQSVAQVGGEMLDIANADQLPRQDRLTVDTLALLFRSTNLPNRTARQALTPRFRTIISELRLGQTDAVGVVLTPMLLGASDSPTAIPRLADALVTARLNVDEPSYSGERKPLLDRSSQFDGWVQRFVRAGTRRLTTLGAPVSSRGDEFAESDES